MDKILKVLILCAWTCLFSASSRCAARADPPVATNEEDLVKFTALNQNPIRFTTEGATQASFQEFMEALRDRLTSGEIHGIPVLVDPAILQESNRYITVELSNSRTESIQLGIDVTNSYIVAYQAGTHAYFLMDAPDSASTYLFPDIPIDNRYTLPFGGAYGDLERAAHLTREEIVLGLQPLTHAISFLGGEGDDNAERARTIIVLLQMVAEAARFKYISYRVGVSIRNQQTFQPDAAMLSLENNWGALSSGVQQSVQGAFPHDVVLTNIRNELVTIDSLAHPTVAVLAMMLFVCNPTTKLSSPQVIRSIVEKSSTDTCNRYEPTVQISGRDGMCVDVSNNAYNDGNPIIMWRCHGLENQLWTLKQDNTIRSKGKCLTTYGYAPGNYIMIFDCNKAVPEATYWHIWGNGTIINPISGLVLSAESSSMGGTLTVETNEYQMRQGWRAGNDTSPFVTSIAGFRGLCMEAQGSSNMWLSNCDGNKREQQWALYPDGSIRPVQNTNLCLTSNGHHQGVDIVIMACSNAGASQRWVFKNDGTIYNLHNEMVMDVKESDPSLNQIIVWPWTGNPNQQWVILF